MRRKFRLHGSRSKVESSEAGATVTCDMGAIAARFGIVRVGPERLLVPLTIFLGALLLFAVEPMIAKMILPWFGGAADVWIVCLLFFQTALLGGYLYAHLLSTRVTPARQWRVHLFLLAASLLFLPVAPGERWKPVGGEEPLFLILALLTASIGLPFLLLSATGPLLQAWMARSRNVAAPATHAIYRLYALSNLASLLALLSYPILIEPALATRVQAWSWSLLYCLFVLLAAATAWSYRNLAPEPSGASRDPCTSVSFGQCALWFALALAPSALLLAMTHHMLRNIAAMPLLWIVPLALYLLSLIVAFDHPRWYYRPVWYVLFAAACGPMIYYVAGDFFTDNFLLRLAFYSGGLFICCMVCHGELAALKPEPVHLTRFYLIVASGGAAGGLLVAAIAPAIFNDDYDLPLLLPAVALLVLFVAWNRIPRSVPNWLRWNGLLCAAYLLVFVTGEMLIALAADFDGNVVSVRNFYGPLRATIVPADKYTPELVQLRNGNIIHGREYTAPERYCEPISYYAPPSGIGATFRELGDQGPLKVGVVGLGTGMIAGYGRAGDMFRFYEINPLVHRLAAGTFHYLSCPGQSSVTIGDARLALEREAPQAYDLLVIDAFSSDAIPVHLLTLEAFQTYWRHIKPDGVLAVHISNQYINLSPVVAQASQRSGKTARLVYNYADPANATDGSMWVLLSSRAGFLSKPALNDPIELKPDNAIRPWTDDYSNLWQLLR